MDAKAYGVPEAQPVRPESAARSSVPRPSLQSSVGNSALARIFEGSDPEQRVRHRAQQATGVDLSSVLLRTGSALPGALGVEAVSLGRAVHIAPGTPPAGTGHGDHVRMHEYAHLAQPGLGYEPGERAAESIALGARTAVSALRPLPSADGGLHFFDPRYHRRAAVHALAKSGLTEADIGRIYAANWERDLSQAHPVFAEIITSWKQLKLSALAGYDVSPEVVTFNAAVGRLRSSEMIGHTDDFSYQGYRFYEHIDNPAGELDPSKIDDPYQVAIALAPSEEKLALMVEQRAYLERERARIAEARADLFQDAGGIPRYMADSRDYMKAQLVRAVESQVGAAMDATTTAGKARDSWTAREKELQRLLPQRTPVSQINGSDVDSSAIARETELQAQELRAGGGDYDGERVSPGLPAPEPVPTPTPPEEASLPPAQRRPLAGPDFVREVDGRFFARHPELGGQRLANDGSDTDLVQEWLALSRQVKAERAQQNADAARRYDDEVARRSQAREEARKQEQARAAAARTLPKALTSVAADAMGRAGHALEDFWSHSNFIELTLGIRLEQLSATLTGHASAPALGPGNVDTDLQTSTFSDRDKGHSLAHKIRALADEIEAELPLVRKVLGVGGQPDPADVAVGSEAGVRDSQHPGEADSWWDIVTDDPVASKHVGRAAAGAAVGARIGAGAGIPGVLVGAGIGGVLAAAGSLAWSGSRDLATPEGVALLRRIAELKEDQSRDTQEQGSHTQIAKDQPGHGGHQDEQLMNDLRTLRFDLAQQCAIQADAEILGALPAVMTAADPAAALEPVLQRLDELIAPVSGHPFQGLILAQKPKADALVGKLLAGAR